MAAEAKVDFAHAVQSWVFGPNAGEDLADGAEVLLHLAFLTFSARCCQDSRSNADGKDLEDWDGVVNALEVGGDAEIGAEGGPDVPVGGVYAGSGRSDTVLHVPSRSAVVSSCSTADGR